MTTSTATTRFATSADGTAIAYQTTGRGPALVIVDGAMCHRALGPARGLAAELAGHFTVYAYDRRNRGESGPGNTPWHVDREIEDLSAILDAAGGSAHVFGSSSGAALALLAAKRGLPIDKLVAYEAPFKVDDSAAPNDADLDRRTADLVAAGRRGDAVKLFLRTVGVPAVGVAVMRLMPAWRQMTAIAHTLPYDLSIVVPDQLGRPLAPGRYADVAQDTVVIAGGNSPEYLRNAQAAIVAQLPRGRLVTLPGQTHLIKAAATAPVVVEHCS